jgi:hypothetical protein
LLSDDKDNNGEEDDMNEGITFNTKKRKRTQLKPLYDSPDLNNDSERATEKTFDHHNNRNVNNRQTIVLVPCTPEEQYRQQQQQHRTIKREKQPQQVTHDQISTLCLHLIFVQPKFQVPMKTNVTGTSLTPNTKRKMHNQFRLISTSTFHM